MSASRRSLKRGCAALSIFFAVPIAAPASAQQTVAAQESGDSPVREAAKHFQRGVTLYGEADYRAALVEFKRAYGLAPNVAVLYNIGETEYQLQDYAAALTTFRRFLGDSSATDTHRAEVESNVEVLRARVGHLSITTDPPGADVTVDDQPVGKTPLEDAVLVSVGHRKVVAAIAGRSPVSRYVDVAAEDSVSVTLTLASLAESPVATAESPQRSLPSDVPPVSSGGGSALRVVGWIATAAFAGGAATFAVLANKEAADLSHARNMFPASAADLSHDANLTTTYSILADSLTAAAIVVGGVTLFSTLSASSSNSSTRGSAGPPRVVLGPASARLQMTF
jgi:tetratricopeptide (TPR) repeat protein